jgi:mersacidin/lichenicidin family type 2 lantibiotic
MSNENIIRAWKDEEYRNGLSKEELSQLPENPAELIELTDEDLEKISGGGPYLPSPSVGSACHTRGCR